MQCGGKADYPVEFALLSKRVVYNLCLPRFLQTKTGRNLQAIIVATLLSRVEGDALIIYFQDVRIIDESRIQSLGQEMTDLVNSTENKNVVLNFQNVSFMSSAMIGKLIQFGKKCKATDVNLRLCDINDNVEEVFKLMKLEKVFKIEKNEEAAIASFSKKGWFG